MWPATKTPFSPHYVFESLRDAKGPGAATTMPEALASYIYRVFQKNVPTLKGGFSLISNITIAPNDARKVTFDNFIALSVI